MSFNMNVNLKTQVKINNVTVTLMKLIIYIICFWFISTPYDIGALPAKHTM